MIRAASCRAKDGKRDAYAQETSGAAPVGSAAHEDHGEPWRQQCCRARADESGEPRSGQSASVGADQRRKRRHAPHGDPGGVVWAKATPVEWGSPGDPHVAMRLQLRMLFAGARRRRPVQCRARRTPISRRPGYPRPAPCAAWGWWWCTAGGSSCPGRCRAPRQTPPAQPRENPTG